MESATIFTASSFQRVQAVFFFKKKEGIYLFTSQISSNLFRYKSNSKFGFCPKKEEEEIQFNFMELKSSGSVFKVSTIIQPIFPFWIVEFILFHYLTFKKKYYFQFKKRMKMKNGIEFQIR